MQNRAMQALQKKGFSQSQMRELLKAFNEQLKLIGRENDAVKKQQMIQALQNQVEQYTDLKPSEIEITKAASAVDNPYMASGDDIPPNMRTSTVIGQPGGVNMSYEQVADATNNVIDNLQQQIELHQRNGEQQQADALIEQRDDVIDAGQNLEQIHWMDREYYDEHHNRNNHNLTLAELIDYYLTRNNYANAAFLHNQNSPSMSFIDLARHYSNILYPALMMHSRNQLADDGLGNNYSGAVIQPIKAGEDQYNPYSNYNKNYDPSMFNYGHNNSLSENQDQQNQYGSLMQLGYNNSTE